MGSVLEENNCSHDYHCRSAMICMVVPTLFSFFIKAFLLYFTLT